MNDSNFFEGPYGVKWCCFVDSVTYTAYTTYNIFWHHGDMKYFYCSTMWSDKYITLKQNIGHENVFLLLDYLYFYIFIFYFIYGWMGKTLSVCLSIYNWLNVHISSSQYACPQSPCFDNKCSETADVLSLVFPLVTYSYVHTYSIWHCLKSNKI